MKTRSLLPATVVAIVVSGMVGAIILIVKADSKTHTVSLKWNPAIKRPGVSVAGYNVYRSTQPGGPYEKIASDLTSPNYIDRAVSSRKTYYYIVRTVDRAGHESPPSNVTSVTIP